MERKQGEIALGFWDTAQKIIQDEGPKALFNGGLTRVLRVSPQFGECPPCTRPSCERRPNFILVSSTK